MEELKCLLLPLQEKNLLVPYALIAEIIPLDTQKLKAGFLEWRGLQIPTIDLEIQQKGSKHYCAIVNKTTQVKEPYSFLAIFLQKMPRIVKVKPADLRLGREISEEDSPYLMEVMVKDMLAFVPNLSSLWSQAISTVGSKK